MYCTRFTSHPRAAFAYTSFAETLPQLVRCSPWLLSGRNSWHMSMYSVNIYCTLLRVRPSTAGICGDAVGSEREQALCFWTHGVYWTEHTSNMYIPDTACLFLTHHNKHEKGQSTVWETDARLPPWQLSPLYILLPDWPLLLWNGSHQHTICFQSHPTWQDQHSRPDCTPSLPGWLTKHRVSRFLREKPSSEKLRRRPDDRNSKLLA